MPVVRYRSSPFDSTCNRSWQLTESPRASRIRPASRIEERSLIAAAVARALVVRDADGHGARAFATRAIVGDEAHGVHAAVTAPEALCAHARGRGAHAFRIRLLLASSTFARRLVLGDGHDGNGDALLIRIGDARDGHRHEPVSTAIPKPLPPAPKGPRKSAPVSTLRPVTPPPVF